MANLLVVTEIQGVSGLAKDRFVNTFAVGEAPDASVATAEAVFDVFVDFFQVVPSGGLVQPAALIGPQALRAPNNHAIKVYDITGKENGAPHGSPVYEDVFALTPTAPVGAIPMPSEVAYCVTLEGVGSSTALVEIPDDADPDDRPERPKQRRRGRIYWPCITTSDITNTGGIARPHARLRDTLVLAIQDLADNLDVICGAGGGLCVWSREDAELRRVNAVSTDDAFDTQRRRGEAPTARTTSPLV